jgi:hypothetical protein
MEITSLNQIEKNLLVFLDPAGNRAVEEWLFVRSEDIGVKDIFNRGKDSRNKKILYSFPKRQLWKYFLFLLKMQLHGKSSGARSFLYINDGILSCLFEAKNRTGYRSFARRHLPKPEKIRQKISRFAPLMLRAEQIYFIEKFVFYDYKCYVPDSNTINKFDFMFFSNAFGKILLACTETFSSGCGQLLKTTANPDYAKVMEKEFEMISEVSSHLGKPKMIPDVGHRFSINGRRYYLEDYIHGQSLLKVLRDLGRKEDVKTFHEQIDQLDCWFKCYISIFNGNKKTISEIYEPILKTFSDIYSNNGNTVSIAKRASHILSEIDKNHSGFTCVISHNDLWPGNFICHHKGLTAVDWERATSNRAPLFDYYWMMISAALTYLQGRASTYDYTLAFPQFLMNRHVMCVFIQNKLKKYLRSLCISEELHKDILLLFLLELSTQGYAAIGTKTSMDIFIYKELNEYVKNKYMYDSNI